MTNIFNKQLKSGGFSHILIPLVTVLLVAVVGSYMIVSSHASSSNAPCKIGSIRGPASGCIKKPKPVKIRSHSSFGNADGLMGHDPTMIVVHYTGGYEKSARDLVRSLNDPTGIKGCNKSCSVQLTVDPKGRAYQLTSRLDVVTEHTINFNDAAIGIEVMGLNGTEIANNTKQINAVASVIVQLMHQYSISMEPNYPFKKGLVGHVEADNWSDVHVGDRFEGRYENSPVVIKSDNHPDPSIQYMRKVRDLVSQQL